MKKLLISMTALGFSVIVFAQKAVNDVAKFVTETINQGNLKQNNPEEVKFIVTNIGKDPLIIEQANPTCGCTMGDYTKSPIAPGASGFITAKFNAANVGHFEKHLTVKFAGIDELKSITISGDVLSPEDYDKWVSSKKKSEVPIKAAMPNKTGKMTKSVSSKSNG